MRFFIRGRILGCMVLKVDVLVKVFSLDAKNVLKKVKKRLDIKKLEVLVIQNKKLKNNTF